MILSVKPEVVVVEDDDTLAQIMKRQLELINITAFVFPLVKDVLNFFQHSYETVHLLLLDLNLPDGNGLWLFQKLQEQKMAVPTIFVTGEADEKIKVRSFDMGGDDYLVKPFSLAEMLSRVNAVLRRTVHACENQVSPSTSLSDKEFYFCGVKVLPTTMEIYFPSDTVRIGKRELGIMSYMMQNPHIVLSRTALVHNVWNKFANTKSRSLDQYIMKIRKLFQQYHCSTLSLKTVHSVGYCYNPEMD
jgi:two-component system alkaline phosphatase synthesis response regulator PhoP